MLPRQDMKSQIYLINSKRDIQTRSDLPLQNLGIAH
jgi:hypothetical protein